MAIPAKGIATTMPRVVSRIFVGLRMASIGIENKEIKEVSRKTRRSWQMNAVRRADIFYRMSGEFDGNRRIHVVQGGTMAPGNKVYRTPAVHMELRQREGAIRKS